MANATAAPATATTAIPSSNAGIDVSALMNGYQGAMSQVAASAADLNDALATGRQGAQEEATGAEQESEAQQQINTLKGAAAAKQIADNSRAAASFGTNPDASSYILAQLGNSVLADEQDLSERRSLIQQKSDLSFMDNPLQWMVNQFTLPMDVYAANVKLSGIDQKMDVIQKLEAATQDQFRTNAAIDQANATKVAADQNAIVAARALAAVGRTQQQLAALGIQGVTAKMAVSRAQLQGLFGLNDAIASKERVDIAEKTAKYQQGFYLATEDQRNMQAQAEKQNQEAVGAIETRLKAGAAIAGVPVAPTYQQYRTMPAAEKSMWDTLSIAGEQGSLGPNAASSADFAAKWNLPLTPGMQDIRNKLQRIIDTARSTSSPLNPGGGQTFKTLGPQIQNTVEQNYIEQTVKTELSNIPLQGSIYSPLSLHAMLTASPVLKTNPIAQDLAPLAVANKNYAANPDDVMKSAFKLVASGKLTPKQAAVDVTDLYKTMQLQLNEVHQYNRFALPRMSSDTGYKQSVSLGTGWGSSTVIDMTNPAAVENLLSRAILSTKLQKEMYDPKVLGISTVGG